MGCFKGLGLLPLFGLGSEASESLDAVGSLRAAEVLRVSGREGAGELLLDPEALPVRESDRGGGRAALPLLLLLSMSLSSSSQSKASSLEAAGRETGLVGLS